MPPDSSFPSSRSASRSSSDCRCWYRSSSAARSRGTSPCCRDSISRAAWSCSPELTALCLGLSIYTSSFIAENVRAGIQAISHGQTEAAGALGLRNSWTLRLVIIPQAMRIIVPPLTSQYLNIVKNSTLAAFMGYPDLVSIFTSTVQNQTGRAVECIAITMLFYLTVSLVDLLLHELVQQAHRVGGTVGRDGRHYRQRRTTSRLPSGRTSGSAAAPVGCGSDCLAEAQFLLVDRQHHSDRSGDDPAVSDIAGTHQLGGHTGEFRRRTWDHARLRAQGYGEHGWSD